MRDEERRAVACMSVDERKAIASMSDDERKTFSSMRAWMSARRLRA
jgi:hypothetical protein